MKTIIAATDFSEIADNAARYALQMAMRTGAELTLLHVLPPALITVQIPLPAEGLGARLKEAKESLACLKEQLEHSAGGALNITCRLVADSFLEEIKALNRSKEVFAVVMGTSRAGAAEMLLFGSFSLLAAKHLDHSLIVIPPGCRYSATGKIGLACDLENALEHLPIDAVADILQRLDAKLEIFYISRSAPEKNPVISGHRSSLQHSFERSRPAIRIAACRDVSEGLEDLAGQSGVDLLLLVARKRNIFRNLFYKSIVKQMVLYAVVPVMILHE